MCCVLHSHVFISWATSDFLLSACTTARGCRSCTGSVATITSCKPGTAGPPGSCCSWGCSMTWWIEPRWAQWPELTEAVPPPACCWSWRSSGCPLEELSYRCCWVGSAIFDYVYLVSSNALAVGDPRSSAAGAGIKQSPTCLNFHHCLCFSCFPGAH